MTIEESVKLFSKWVNELIDIKSTCIDFIEQYEYIDTGRPEVRQIKKDPIIENGHKAELANIFYKRIKEIICNMEK